MPTPLYTTDLLRLAASIPHEGRLPAPHGSAEHRSAVCGSRLTVDVATDADSRVSALGLDVHACALGQAAASLMAAHAIGRTPAELAAARDDLAAWLGGQRDDPGAWPGLDALAPARSHPSRHPAILLAFRAAADASAQAAQKAAA